MGVVPDAKPGGMELYPGRMGVGGKYPMLWPSPSDTLVRSMPRSSTGARRTMPESDTRAEEGITRKSSVYVRGAAWPAVAPWPRLKEGARPTNGAPFRPAMYPSPPEEEELVWLLFAVVSPLLPCWEAACCCCCCCCWLPPLLTVRGEDDTRPAALPAPTPLPPLRLVMPLEGPMELGVSGA